jgi:hypothetical protein
MTWLHRFRRLGPSKGPCFSNYQLEISSLKLAVQLATIGCSLTWSRSFNCPRGNNLGSGTSRSRFRSLFHFSASATEKPGLTSGTVEFAAALERFPPSDWISEEGHGGSGISFEISNEEPSSGKNECWTILDIPGRFVDLGDCEGDGPVLGALENDSNPWDSCDIM